MMCLYRMFLSFGTHTEVKCSDVYGQFFFFFFFLVFQDRVSLYSPGCPGKQKYNNIEIKPKFFFFFF